MNKIQGIILEIRVLKRNKNLNLTAKELEENNNKIQEKIKNLLNYIKNFH